MAQVSRCPGAMGFCVALCGATIAVACVTNATSGSGGSSGGGGTGGLAGTGGAATSSGGGTGSGGMISGGTGGGGATVPGSGGMTSGGTGGSPAGSGGMSSAGGRVGSGGAAAGGGAASGGRGGASGGWSSTFPTFIKHTIATFSGGYATVAVDIDHDGMLDVVALSSTSGGLVWFKNPSWQKFTITTKATKLIYLSPHDVDGDGDMDVAFVSDFDMNNSMAGGTFSWAEAPADPTQSQDWTLHKIDAIPTTHRLRWADIDGDDKQELIVLPIFGVGSTAPTRAGFVQLKAYFVPSDPKTGTWTSKVLDDKHLEVAHALTVVDWDGDKAADLLAAANDGIYLFRPGMGGAAEHIGAGKPGTAPDKGSSEAVLGSLGGARFVASIEFWHGTDGVIYTPGASATALWTRQVLGADFEHGHGMGVGDFNGDGFDEVVGGGGQGKLAQLIYRYVPSSKTWDKIELDTGGVAVSEIDVKDINGDGAPDILAIGGSPTNNVVWYENSR